MNLKEIYEYTYYKVYKSMDFMMSWGADWRASGLLLAIELILFYSFALYYWVINQDGYRQIGYGWVFIPVGILYTIDYFVVQSKDQWKEIIEKYDAWPPKKNFIGTLIVWSIIFLVIANFLLAINIYEQVDWSQYYSK